MLFSIAEAYLQPETKAQLGFDWGEPAPGAHPSREVAPGASAKRTCDFVQVCTC